MSAEFFEPESVVSTDGDESNANGGHVHSSSMQDECTVDECIPIRKGDIPAAVEAMLFVSGDPVEVNALAAALSVEKGDVLQAADELRRRYRSGPSGFVLRGIDDKLQLATDGAFSPFVERLLQPAKRKSFSQSVMETLSIIAYKQPVTRAEIEAVRGVRCEYAVSQLLQSGFVDVVGRKDAVGRPALLGTTEKFLIHFGLSSITELPRRDEILGFDKQEMFETE